MALTDSEIARLRYELGYPVLSVSAEPYVGFVQLFDQIIKPYTLGGAATTSSTPVTAASAPTPQTLTLASATGVTAGCVVVIDVDSRQERATVQSLSGSAMTVQLSLAHSGVFPIVVEGGESIIRDLLRELRSVGDTISKLRSRAGIKSVDDVQFFGGGATLASQGIDPITQVLALRETWRDELASILNIPRRNGGRNSGGNDVSVY
jgi:hypothetical protein